MPGKSHDKLFGGQPGAAQQVLQKMRATYGPKKGQQVYDATVIKRQRKQARPPKKKR